MVTRIIEGKEWVSSGSMHYDRNDAVKVQKSCKKRGVRARLLKITNQGDTFWLVFIDDHRVEWLCDVDKSWEER
jgi:hypothetical protein